MLKARKKITRRELKEDKFVTYTFKTQKFMQQNFRNVLTYSISALVLFVIIFVYISSKQKAERNAEAEVGQAEIFYEYGDYETAQTQFTDIIDNYKGTSGAGKAVFYLANINFEQKNYDEAKNYFQLYLDDYRNDDLLAGSSCNGIGECLEDQGKYQEAINYYEEALKEFDSLILAPEFLLNIGRCYELSDQKDEAQNTYKLIIEKYPDSLFTQEAEKFLSLL